MRAVEHLPHPADERVGERRRRHPLAGEHEKRVGEVAAQLTKAERHRRLAERQALRRPGDRGGRVHRLEQPKVTEIESH